MGLENVQTVIASGNILFNTDADPSSLESELEARWKRELGFESTTIVRSREDLYELLEWQPFGDLEHGPKTYLLVTFSRQPLKVEFELPCRPPGKDFTIAGATSREISSISDTTAGRTPDVMSWLEKQFGKEITSRTWLTTTRILDRMGV